MKKRMEALFSGRVQGVGFRFTVSRIAGRFNVAGFVRNLPDGKVELVAEGEETELRAFLGSVRESSMQPNIRDVETSWKEPESRFATFSIKA